MNNEYQFKPQLCWTCQKAVGGCSWSDEFNPVDGWEAIKVNRTESKSSGYYITKCPEFIEDI